MARNGGSPSFFAWKVCKRMDQVRSNGWNFIEVLLLTISLWFFEVSNVKTILVLIGTVIRDDSGLSLENADKGFLGTASKVVITKDSTLIVTDGSTQKAVKQRVSQLKRLVEVLWNIIKHYKFTCTACSISSLSYLRYQTLYGCLVSANCSVKLEFLV